MLCLLLFASTSENKRRGFGKTWQGKEHQCATADTLWCHTPPEMQSQLRKSLAERLPWVLTAGSLEAAITQQPENSRWTTTLLLFCWRKPYVHCTSEPLACTQQNESRSISKDLTGAARRQWSAVLNGPDTRALQRTTQQHNSISAHCAAKSCSLWTSDVCHSNKVSHFTPQALLSPTPTAYTIDFVHKEATSRLWSNSRWSWEELVPPSPAQHSPCTLRDGRASSSSSTGRAMAPSVAVGLQEETDMRAGHTCTASKHNHPKTAPLHISHQLHKWSAGQPSLVSFLNESLPTSTKLLFYRSFLLRFIHFCKESQKHNVQL